MLNVVMRNGRKLQEFHNDYFANEYKNHLKNKNNTYIQMSFLDELNVPEVKKSLKIKKK